MVTSDRLRKAEIFQGLTEEELKKAAPFCQEQFFPKGVFLCEEGGRADKFFILEEGSISIRFQKGVNFCIQTPGKILGWSFLVPPNRYTASGQTMVPSSLLVMQSPDFYYLIHKEPRMGVKVMGNLARVVAGRLLQWSAEAGSQFRVEWSAFPQTSEWLSFTNVVSSSNGHLPRRLGQLVQGARLGCCRIESMSGAYRFVIGV